MLLQIYKVFQKILNNLRWMYSEFKKKIDIIS